MILCLTNQCGSFGQHGNLNNLDFGDNMKKSLAIVLYAYEQFSVAAKVPSFQGIGVYKSCSRTVFAPLARRN